MDTDLVHVLVALAAVFIPLGVAGYMVARVSRPPVRRTRRGPKPDTPTAAPPARIHD